VERADDDSLRRETSHSQQAISWGSAIMSIPLKNVPALGQTTKRKGKSAPALWEKLAKMKLFRRKSEVKQFI
jgi:hypothetical protein